MMPGQLIITPDDEFGQPYRIMMRDIAAVTPAYLWCVEHLDPPATVASGARWQTVGQSFWFRDERDAFQFRMRWC
jgi:hypothetical protein